MKKSLKSICLLLAICFCLPLFVACGDSAAIVDNAAKTNSESNYYSFDTSSSTLPKPEYSLPELGSILNTVITGRSVASDGDASDYARYDNAFSLNYNKADGNWYRNDGTRVYPKANSSLNGKTIYWLGSSETLGVWTQTSTADALAALTGCKIVKNAFGGSTMLVDRAFNVGFGQSPNNADQNSKLGRRLGEFNFIDRLNPDLPGNTTYDGYNEETWSYTKFDKTASVDAFIIAVSTNDAANYYSGGNENRRGKILPYEYDKDAFDVHTSIGAMEYMVAYIYETWHCPIYFYTSPYFGSATTDQVDPSTGGVYKPHPFDANPLKLSYDPQGSTYAAEITWAKMIVEKWKGHGLEIGIIDMYNDPDFNAIGDTLYEVKDRETGEYSWMSYYQWSMYDHVHAKNAGYIQWWAPYVEWYLHNALFGV